MKSLRQGGKHAHFALGKEGVSTVDTTLPQDSTKIAREGAGLLLQISQLHDIAVDRAAAGKSLPL